MHATMWGQLKTLAVLEVSNLATLGTLHDSLYRAIDENFIIP
jgi:hypothetical protein